MVAQLFRVFTKHDGNGSAIHDVILSYKRGECLVNLLFLHDIVFPLRSVTVHEGIRTVVMDIHAV